MNTILKEVVEASFSRFGFEFVEFDDILSKDIDLTCLVDVIGNLVKIGNIIECNVSYDDKLHKRLEIHIQNTRNDVIICTLWDTYADQFAPYIDVVLEDRVIVIIQFVGRYVTMATIEDIEDKNGWFKVEVMVNDGSSIKSFTIFDSDVEQIVGKSVSFILSSLSKDVDVQSISADLHVFLNKTFLFIIDVKDYNNENSNSGFSVYRVTNDQVIITEFKKGLQQTEATLKRLRDTIDVDQLGEDEVADFTLSTKKQVVKIEKD